MLPTICMPDGVLFCDAAPLPPVFFCTTLPSEDGWSLHTNLRRKGSDIVLGQGERGVKDWE